MCLFIRSYEALQDPVHGDTACIPMAYPTTSQKIATAVNAQVLFGNVPQNVAAMVGPPMVALEAIKISS